MDPFMEIIRKKNLLLENFIRYLLSERTYITPHYLQRLLFTANSPLNLANLFSYLRGILIIPMLMLIQDQQYFGALVIFLMGMLMDLLDGPLARALDLVSEFGKLLDPLMDKLIFFAVLIAFYPKIHKIIFFSLVITELSLIIYPGIILYLEKKISGANSFGKYKMNVMTLAIIVLLINPQAPSWLLVVNFILALAAILSILSFIGHLKKLTA